MKQILLSFILLCLVGCGHSGTSGGTAPSSRQVYPPGTGPGMSTEVGAGGSGVYCPGYFEITDVYEARKRGMGPVLGAPTLSVREKIQMALGRLARLSPLRAARYRERAQFILEKAYYFKKGYIPHIADDDPQDLGEGCVLVTIATRRKPVFPNDPEFLINEQLWNLLDNDNKAALVLHEVVYEEAYKDFGQRSSRYSRALVSQFFSTSIDRLSFPEFLRFLDTVEFLKTDHGGLQILTKMRTDNGFRTGTTWIADQEAIVSVEYGQNLEAGLSPQAYDYFGTTLLVGGGYHPTFYFQRGRLRLVYGSVYTGAAEAIEDRGNRLLPESSAAALTFFDENGRFKLVTVKRGSRLRQAGETFKEVDDLHACAYLNDEGFAEILGNGECGRQQADLKHLEIPERIRAGL